METTDNLYQRNGTWYGRFSRNGKLVRISLDTSDYDDARVRVNAMIARTKLLSSGRVRAGRQDIVYFAHDVDLNMIKIGLTNNLESRMRSMQSNTASEIRLLGSVTGGIDFEKLFHRFLTPFHHRGEWFRATPEVIDFVLSLIALAKICTDTKRVENVYTENTETVSCVS